MNDDGEVGVTNDGASEEIGLWALENRRCHVAGFTEAACVLDLSAAGWSLEMETAEALTAALRREDPDGTASRTKRRRHGHSPSSSQRLRLRFGPQNLGL